MGIVVITAVGLMVAGEGNRSREVFCNDGGGGGCSSCGITLVGRQGG